MARLKVTNTKAIKNLDVDLTPGTITVLNGPNGAGKSTTLDVLQSAITKKNIGDLQPTDGERAGLVEFDGVTIKVGRRVSFSGEPEGTVCLVEGGDDILGFINPGIKDPEAADRKRLEKLCSIVGAELTDSDLRKFIGDDLWDDYRSSKASSSKSGGIVDTVKTVKRWLEEQARDLEAKIVACTTEIDTIGNVPSGNTEVPDVVAMQLQADQIVVDLGNLRARQKASREAAESLDSIRDVLLDEESLRHDLEVTVQSLDGVATDIAAVEQRLVELKAERAALESTRGSLLEKIDTAKRQSTRLEALQQQARDAVTDEQIAELEHKRSEQQQSITDAIVLRDRLKTSEESRQKLATLKSQREKLEAQAERCRARAVEAPTMLQKVVENLAGWTISTDVRLCCATDRSKHEAFSDLSPGLKAVRALELSCMRPGTGSGRKIVVLPQEVWESLDGKNRQLVHKWTKERGLIVVTGECRQREKCDACGCEQQMGHEVCEACESPMQAERLTAEKYTP
jgi:energy-coupling factor transporter ATP-binding protein EcfA2